MKNDPRKVRFAAINATWKKLRPDLRGAEDLREARLDFAAQVLGYSIGSFGDLGIRELDRVIEAMKRSAQGSLLGDRGQVTGDRVVRGNFGSPGVSPASSNQSPSADVVHLASEEQVWAIEQVLGYLRSEWGWTEEGCAGFLKKNYRRPGARLLTPRQASGALTILLSITSKKEIDRRLGNHDKRSRAEIRAGVPALKKRIGIDRMNRINRKISNEETA